MAFKEQCKYAMIASAEALLAKDIKRNVTKALKQLSQESGISLRTCQRWFYETVNEESNANSGETVTKQQDCSSENNDLTTENAGQQKPKMCVICKIRTARIKNRNGRIVYQNKCNHCEGLGRKRDKEYHTICPHCGKLIFLSQHHLQRRNEDGNNKIN